MTEPEKKFAYTLSKWLEPKTVFVLSFGLLLAIHISLTATNDWLSLPPKPQGDGLVYENIAFHLWNGEGFVFDNTNSQWRSLYESSQHTNQGEKVDYSLHLNAPALDMAATGRPPLQPMVLASIYAVVGRNGVAFAAFRIFSAICLAASGAIAASLVAWYWKHAPGRSATAKQSETQLDGNRTAYGLVSVLVVVGLASSNRTLQDYTTDLLTEPLALILMQLFVLSSLALTSRNGASLPSMVVPGILFGLLILCRSIFVVWLPGIVILQLLTDPGRWSDLRNWKVRLQRAGILLLTTLLVCVPWWTRNVLVLDAWMPLGTQGPITLLGGFSDEGLASGGEWQHAPELRLRREFATHEDWLELNDDTEREVALAREASVRVKKWVGRHLSDIPSLFLGRVVTHWNPYSGRSLLWKAFILLGVIGLAWRNFANRSMPEQRWSASEQRWSAERMALVWWLGLPILSTLVAMLLYTVGGRFLVPVYGVLYILSGLGVSFLACRIRTWLSRSGAQ